MVGAVKIGGYTGGRKSGGYSLRRSLEAQGVTTETGMQAHMSVLLGTIAENPQFDITSYRVDANNPNVPMMG